MPDSEFQGNWDRHYVEAVRSATEVTYGSCAGGDMVEAYLTLSRELRRRGVEPEPSAVYDGALLISRGRRPAILRSSGHAPYRGRRIRGHDPRPAEDA